MKWRALTRVIIWPTIWVGHQENQELKANECLNSIWMYKMESFGHTCTHIHIPNQVLLKVSFWCDPHNLTIIQYWLGYRCQDYGQVHPRWRAHFLEGLLAALRLSNWRRGKDQHYWSWGRVVLWGKTEPLKCQIDDGCDGWSLDTLPPPHWAKKNGIFYFHKIMQTAVRDLKNPHTCSPVIND